MKKKERERKRIEENNSEVYKLRDKFSSKLGIISSWYYEFNIKAI